MTENSQRVTYKATFLIRGHDLDPDEVTQLLGVMPTDVARRGDRTKSGRELPCGSWHFESGDPGEDAVKHIEAALKPFANRTDELHKLKSRGFDITVWVSHFMADDGGYELSADLMRLCSKLGTSLSISIILHDE